MSLINEALKRTRDASLRTAPAGAVADASYRMTATPAAAAAGRGTTVMMGVAAAAGVLTLAVVLAGQWWLGRPQGPTPAVVAAGHAAPATPPASAVPTAVVGPADPQVAEDQLVQRLLERIDQARPAAPASATETTVSAAATPALVLQGVSRFQGQYEAMISGYTVRLGEEVLGARVVAIEARTVRLQRGTEEIVLRLR